MRTNQIGSEYCTAAELAMRLGEHERTITRWLDTRGIPGAIKVNRHWRINKKTVDQWLTKAEETGALEFLNINGV